MNICCFYLACDIGIAFLTETGLTIPSFCDLVNFSITIQARFTTLDLHINHSVYMSARHVSPYNLGSTYLIYTLMMERVVSCYIDLVYFLKKYFHTSDMSTIGNTICDLIVNIFKFLWLGLFLCRSTFNISHNLSGTLSDQLFDATAGRFFTQSYDRLFFYYHW